MGFVEPGHIEGGYVEFGAGVGLLPTHGVETAGADGDPSSIFLQSGGEGAASDNMVCWMTFVVEASFVGVADDVRVCSYNVEGIAVVLVDVDSRRVGAGEVERQDSASPKAGWVEAWDLGGNPGRPIRFGGWRGTPKIGGKGVRDICHIGYKTRRPGHEGGHGCWSRRCR